MRISVEDEPSLISIDFTPIFTLMEVHTLCLDGFSVSFAVYCMAIHKHSLPKISSSVSHIMCHYANAGLCYRSTIHL